MDILKYSLLVFFLFLYGCPTDPTKTDVGNIKQVTRIDSSVEYVGPNNVRLIEAQYPKDVVLMFPYISGAIFGTPSAAPIYITKVDEKLNFSLDLTGKIKEIDDASTPVAEEWVKLGLVVEPKQTRISRIGTFPYSYATGRMIGAGGFINSDSRNNMILVYVDRACEIKGEIDLDGEHYSHNLSFSGKGFHWLELVKRSKHEYILQTYFGEDNVNFSVHIENIQLI